MTALLRAISARGAGAELATVALLLLAITLPGAISLPLIGRDEGRFAQASREMEAADEWVVPTFAGADRYDKPVLIYWAMRASFRAFGVTPLAVRVPSLLAALSLVLILGAWARLRWGPGAGLLAGGLLAAVPTFSIQAAAATADMVMLLPTTVAMLLAWWLAERAQRGVAISAGERLAAAAMWLALGLSLLAKGPVGPAALLMTGVTAWWLASPRGGWAWVAVLTGLVIGWAGAGPLVLVPLVLIALVDSLRCDSSRRLLAGLGLAWGPFLMLLVVAPWAVLAWQRSDGEFFRSAIGHHLVERSLGALESHAGMPGFYLLTGLLAAWPLVAVVWPAAVARWRREAFLIAWLIGPLVMIELVATKMVHYWLVSYPAAALLAASWLLDHPRSKGIWALAWPGALALSAAPLVLVSIHGLEAWPQALLSAALPLIAILASRERSSQAMIATLGLAACAWLLAVKLVLLPAVLGETIVPRTVAAVSELQRPGERLLVYKSRDDEIFFSLPLSAKACKRTIDLDDAIEDGPDWLGLARPKELERYLAERPDLEIDIVHEVEGLDLGRGRRVEVVFFRPRS